MPENLFKDWVTQLLDREPMTVDASDSLRLDHRAVQATHYFAQTPRVICVNSLDTLTPLQRYEDILSLEYSPDEEEVISGIAAGLNQNDPQILVTDLSYSQDENTVYMALRRTDYACVRAHSLGKFSTESQFSNQPFGKTGTLLQVVTTDGYVYYFERSKEKKPPLNLKLGLHSVAAGFLDVTAGFQVTDDGLDVLQQNAKKEFIEEIAGEYWESILSASATNPQICGLSFRYFRNTQNKAMPFFTLEFVGVIPLGITADKFEKVILSNCRAKDRTEHTGQSSPSGDWSLNFRKLHLTDDITKMSEYAAEHGLEYVPGRFLYEPVHKSCQFIQEQLLKLTSRVRVKDQSMTVSGGGLFSARDTSGEDEATRETDVGPRL